MADPTAGSPPGTLRCLKSTGGRPRSRRVARSAEVLPVPRETTPGTVRPAARPSVAGECCCGSSWVRGTAVALEPGGSGHSFSVRGPRRWTAVPVLAQRARSAVPRGTADTWTDVAHADTAGRRGRVPRRPRSVGPRAPCAAAAAGKTRRRASGVFHVEQGRARSRGSLRRPVTTPGAASALPPAAGVGGSAPRDRTLAAERASTALWPPGAATCPKRDAGHGQQPVDGRCGRHSRGAARRRLCGVVAADREEGPLTWADAPPDRDGCRARRGS
jgi:hypothetical protein